MAKLARKELVVHLDRFAGSGPVTIEEVRAIVEARIAGATLNKKFSIDPTVRKKDNELIKIHIFFVENVDNATIEQIRGDILALSGVLEGGVGDAFPVLVPESSDDFELYTPSGTNILASSQNIDVTWTLVVDEASAVHVIDSVNPPTFESDDSLVSEGSLSARLKLPKASTNVDASVKVAGVAPAESKKIRLEAVAALMKDPLTGCVEVTLNKVSRFCLYGSRYFNMLGPDADKNGRAVLYSKNPTGGETASFMSGYQIRFGMLYRLYVFAEVNGLLFDAIMVSEDELECGFKHGLTQLEGIATADLQSGALSVKVKNIRSTPGAGGGDTDGYANAWMKDLDAFNLGVTSDTGFGTCIDLNNIDTFPYIPGPKGGSGSGGAEARVEVGDISFWNSSLTEWTVEIRCKRHAFMNTPGNCLISCGQPFSEPGGWTIRRNSGYPGSWNMLYTRGNKDIVQMGAQGAAADDVWQHVAFQWTGTQLELLLDGVLKARVPFTTAPVTPAHAVMHIGQEFLGNTAWKGLLDEFRLSKVARFTAANLEDTAAEYQTTPYTSDADTLRLFHFDEAAEGAGDWTAAIVDSGPGAVLTPDDIDSIVDEISVVAEG